VLTGAATAHLNKPAEIYVGLNPVGGSSTARFFSGQILGIEPADSAKLRSALVSPP